MHQSKELLGAEIQYFRTEPRYWERLIQRLKDTGLRCVTTYVQWGTHAVGLPDRRHPAGVFDFEGRSTPQLNLKRFLALVEKHGLNLNLRCGPFCCNEMPYGGYPSWLSLGDPEMMVWDSQNRPAQGYWIAKRAGSQPSYLHPGYLRLCALWLAAVDEVALPHLRANGGCITMMNLDNEVSYIVKDAFLSSDYNPVNVRPGGFYHRFLREKYGALDALPYGRRYTSWADVQPPRTVPAEIGTDLAWHTDWVAFKTWTMCAYLRRLRAMHTANGVRGVTFMTNLNPHLPEGVPTRMPDFERATGGIVGYDFYRGTFMSYSGYHSMARVLKLMNASLSYTWSAEFMAGTWHRVLGSRVSDDHMRFMVRCALAHGCKAVAWFMFHDRDCWGDSPVSSHGHPRPSLDVLREVPDLLFTRIRNWDALVPQTDVAIIYDLLQHQHTTIGDPSPCSDNVLHEGAPVIDGTPAGRSSREYFGLFRLIEQAGRQPGVVDILHAPHRLAGYRLAFLPGSPVLERAANRALREYVRAGGTLILSGAWPERDEHGRRIRFLGASLPQGARPTVACRLGAGRLVWSRAWIAQEEPEQESLAGIARVAGWLRRYAGPAHVHIQPATPVSWIDRPSGGEASLCVQPRNLGSAVLHRGPGECVLFVLNHYPDAVRFRVRFATDGVHTLHDLSTGERTPVRRGQAVLDIDRKSAAIYRCEEASAGV